jgi:hypothetical protein
MSEEEESQWVKVEVSGVRENAQDFIAWERKDPETDSSFFPPASLYLSRKSLRAKVQS